MVSPAYERRNELARAEGYRSYYDKRVHGGLPPSAPVTSEMRAEHRGHRSLADLERLLARVGPDGALVMPIGVERGAQGRWTQVDVTVVLPNGTSREFVLRGRQASQQSLLALRRGMVAAGIPFVPTYTVDAFDDDEPGDLEDYDVEDEVA
jgi:hypothetical protein